MKDAQSEAQVPDASFGYAGAPVCGDHCMVDVDKVAIPGPGSASVANPIELLLDGGSTLFAGSNIVKQKTDWTSW